MTANGAAFENNIVLRTAFFHPVPSTILDAAKDQWPYFLFLILSIGAYSLLPHIITARKSKRYVTVTAILLATMTALSFWRWFRGVGSNVLPSAVAFSVQAEALALTIIAAVPLLVTYVLTRQLIPLAKSIKHKRLQKDHACASVYG